MQTCRQTELFVAAAKDNNKWLPAWQGNLIKSFYAFHQSHQCRNIAEQQKQQQKCRLVNRTAKAPTTKP